MKGPRDYSAGTRAAVATLANGTCYYPDCKTPIVVFIDGEPFVNYEIAHIRDAKPGNRYDPGMSDDARGAYANLLLLCKPHHTLVDKTHPERFTSDDLRVWKVAREGAGIEALSGLRGLTEDRLAEILEEAVRSIGRTREVILELTGGTVLPRQGVASVTVAGWRTVLEHNPMLRDRLVLVATARNTGHLAASVESFNLYCAFSTPSTPASEPPALTLLGRNDFPALNPAVPVPLPVGASVHWYTRLATLAALVGTIAGGSFDVTGVYADAKLGSGETITSARYPLSVLPLDLPDSP